MTQYHVVYNPDNNRFIEYDDYAEFIEAISKNDEVIPCYTDLLEEKQEFIRRHLFNMSLDMLKDGLREKQRLAIDRIADQKSVFITGPPGTGKSFLLDRIIKLLKTNQMNYSVTATTGCAAVNVNGRTVHSLFGIKPFTDDFGYSHVNHLMYKNKHIYNSLLNLEALIIDEVSMLDDVICDGMDKILKIIKRSDQPFGGIQMILVGDFYQLPPVTNNFCFLSSSWQALNPVMIELDELMRQKDDNLFQVILMAIRKGKIGPKLINHLRSLKDIQFKNGIVPTRLFPKNVHVDHINKVNLDKLRDGRLFRTYHPRFKGMDTVDGYSVEICQGAQVMVTRNIDITEGIVNGSRGVVDDISDEEEVKLTLVNGKKVIIPYTKDYTNKRMTNWIEFMPLKIAYAISIHKSQGMTLDALEIDLGDSVFENGQAYTALSRGTTLDQIRIINIERRSFKTDPRVVRFYNR